MRKRTPSRLTAIAEFYKLYPTLCKLSFLSLIVVIFYAATYNWPPLFPGAGLLLTILFNFALAILANTLFCFTQIHLPERKKRQQYAPALLNILLQIKRLITGEIEHLYALEFHTEKKFEDMTDPELNKLFQNHLDEEARCMIHAPDEENPSDVYMYVPPIRDALHDAGCKIQELCTIASSLYPTAIYEGLPLLLATLYQNELLALYRNYFYRNQSIPGIRFGYSGDYNPAVSNLQKEYKKLLVAIQYIESIR